MYIICYNHTVGHLIFLIENINTQVNLQSTQAYKYSRDMHCELKPSPKKTKAICYIKYTSSFTSCCSNFWIFYFTFTWGH